MDKLDSLLLQAWNRISGKVRANRVSAVKRSRRAMRIPRDCAGPRTGVAKKCVAICRTDARILRHMSVHGTSRSNGTSTRLDFRVKPEHKALIEDAASVEGRTVTDFAVAVLVKAAAEVIERATVTSLSARDSKVFLSMLAADAAPNAALKAAAKRYKKNRG
jgi:uncharacterized protein (DUF1778 family)